MMSKIKTYISSRQWYLHTGLLGFIGFIAVVVFGLDESKSKLVASFTEQIIYLLPIWIMLGTMFSIIFVLEIWVKILNNKS